MEGFIWRVDMASEISFCMVHVNAQGVPGQFAVRSIPDALRTGRNSPARLR